MNRRLLALLAAGHFATDTYPGAFIALLPAIVQSLRLSYTEAGLVATALTFSYTVTQPLFGLIVDRRDRLWLIPAGCLVAAISLSLVGVAPTYGVLVFLVIIGGFGVSVFHPASSKAANRVAGLKKASAMTFYTTGGSFGYAVGPAAATLLLANFGVAGSLYLALPGLVAAFWLWRLLPAIRSSAPALTTLNRSRLDEVRQVWRPLSRLLALVAFRMVAHWGLLTFFPLYLIANRGATPTDASRLLAIFLFAGAIGTPFGGMLADRIGLKPIVIVSLLIQPPLIYLLLGSSGIATDVLIAVIGLCQTLVVPLMIVIAQEMLPGNVALAGGLILGLGFGFGGLGMSALGAFADAAGLETALMLVTLISLPGAFLALGLPSRQPRLARPAVVSSKEG